MGRPRRARAPCTVVCCPLPRGSVASSCAHCVPLGRLSCSASPDPEPVLPGKSAMQAAVHRTPRGALLCSSLQGRPRPRRPPHVAAGSRGSRCLFLDDGSWEPVGPPHSPPSGASRPLLSKARQPRGQRDQQEAKRGGVGALWVLLGHCWFELWDSIQLESRLPVPSPHSSQPAPRSPSQWLRSKPTADTWVSVCDPDHGPRRGPVCISGH